MVIKQITSTLTAKGLFYMYFEIIIEKKSLNLVLFLILNVCKCGRYIICKATYKFIDKTEVLVCMYIDLF